MLGMIIPKIISFILVPIFSRYLSPSEYGTFYALNTLSMIFTILFTLSMQKAIPRLYFDYKDELERKKYLGTIFVGLSGISLISLILILVFQNQISMIYESIEFYPYFLLTILASFFGVFSLIPLAFYQINELPSKFITLSIILFLIESLSSVILVIVLDYGVIGLLVSKVIAPIILFPIYMKVIFNNTIICFDYEKFISSLKFSLPFIPTLLTVWVINLSDKLFLERMTSLEKVGIYSIAYAVASLVLMVSESLNRAIMPYFYRILTNDNDQKRAALVQSQYIKLIIFTSFGIYVFSGYFIEYFFDKSYHEAITLFPILVPAIMFSQLCSVYSLSISQTKKTYVLMYIHIVVAILNLLFNYFFILNYGIMGAAIATLITFILNFIIYYFVAKRLNPLDIFSNSVLLFIITICIAVGVVSFYNSLLLDIIVLVSVILFLVNSIRKDIVE